MWSSWTTGRPWWDDASPTDSTASASVWFCVDGACNHPSCAAHHLRREVEELATSTAAHKAARRLLQALRAAPPPYPRVLVAQVRHVLRWLLRRCYYRQPGSPSWARRGRA